MNNPLVSIIIPTYNRAHLIGETLDSILAQTYKNWECIIVDDKSRDTTDEVVEQYIRNDARFQFHYRPGNRPKGANACRNYGFELSKGLFISWFDSDDLMEKNMLQHSISDLEADSGLQFVLFDFCQFEDNINNVLSVQKNFTQHLIEDYATWKINFGTWAIVWKRELVAQYRFDENLSRAQDLDFNSRIFFNEKFRFKNSNTIGVYLRSHSDRLTADFNKMNLKSLTSEIQVRKNLITNLIALKTDEKIIRASIQIFNIGMIKLIRGNNHSLFLKEVKGCLSFKNGTLRKTIWFFKLMGLTTVHKLFGKADLKIKKHLITFPFGESNL